MKEDGDGLGRLETKLDTLIRLMALSLMSDGMSVKERAVLLSKAGLPPKEIAALCDTTSNTVSVALSVAKKDARTKLADSKV